MELCKYYRLWKSSCETFEPSMINRKDLIEWLSRILLTFSIPSFRISFFKEPCAPNMTALFRTIKFSKALVSSILQVNRIEQPRDFSNVSRISNSLRITLKSISFCTGLISDWFVPANIYTGKERKSLVYNFNK